VGEDPCDRDYGSHQRRQRDSPKSTWRAATLRPAVLGRCSRYLLTHLAQCGPVNRLRSMRRKLPVPSPANRSQHHRMSADEIRSNRLGFRPKLELDDRDHALDESVSSKCCRQGFRAVGSSRACWPLAKTRLKVVQMVEQRITIASSRVCTPEPFVECWSQDRSTD
jgi:hypothetical protein